MVGDAENRNWARARDLLSEDLLLLINGELTESSSERTYGVETPITGKEITRVPDADELDVESAVNAATIAFPPWRHLPPLHRAALLTEVADIVESHIDELSILDAVNGGIPISEAARDASKAAEWCRYFAGLALEMKGHSIPSSTGTHFTVREPFGVVARILAFNHPLLFAVKAFAPPLVAGNCVIVKPSELTPLSVLYLSRILKEVFPPGVLQVIVGNGPTVPRALVAHADVRRIAFTGSEETGRAILRDAAQSGVKNVSLELGGKNALVAYPDAEPSEVARDAIRGMNFSWSGQSCGSTSRLIIHNSIADDVVSTITSELCHWRIGSSLDPQVDQGPLISKAHLSKVQLMIQQALDSGAVLARGGTAPLGPDNGHYLEPTVLDHISPADPIAQEEVFGPVLAVIRWEDPDDPIAIANSARYGLTASVYTNDVRQAHRAAHSLEAGFVWVNDVGRHFTGMPFGGYKSSGIGREESLDELLSYTQEKSINIPF